MIGHGPKAKLDILWKNLLSYLKYSKHSRKIKRRTKIYYFSNFLQNRVLILPITLLKMTFPTSSTGGGLGVLEDFIEIIRVSRFSRGSRLLDLEGGPAVFGKET